MPSSDPAATRLSTLELLDLDARASVPGLARMRLCRGWIGVLSAALLCTLAGVGAADAATAAAADVVARQGVEARPFTVVIDPGHGGSDPGSTASNGLSEKVLTIDVARRIRLFLSEVPDIEVVLTREDDAGLSRADRVRRIRGSAADAFVSLHFNHLPQPDVTLVETYYAAEGNIERSRAVRAARAARAGDAASATVGVAAMPTPVAALTEGSARLARFVQRRVHDEVRRDNPGASDAGVKRRTLFVLTRSHVPGVLVEITCLSNAYEAERLSSDAYLDGLAAGLADAIRDYKRSLDAHPLGELGV